MHASCRVYRLAGCAFRDDRLYQQSIRIAKEYPGSANSEELD
jgi:hypothetical protein